MTLRRFESHEPRLGPGAWVDDSAIVIGDVELGEDTSIWPGCVVRGDIHAIRIGARSNIQDGAVLHVTHASEFNPEGFPLRIGDDVIVGHRATLHGCTVGDGCLIGMGAVILDGAVIGAGTMIAAGALVPPGKTLEGGCLWVGAPVRRARPLTPEERAHLRYSVAHYVRLKDRHRNAQRGD